MEWISMQKHFLRYANPNPGGIRNACCSRSQRITDPLGIKRNEKTGKEGESDRKREKTFERKKKQICFGNPVSRTKHVSELGQLTVEEKKDGNKKKRKWSDNPKKKRSEKTPIFQKSVLLSAPIVCTKKTIVCRRPEQTTKNASAAANRLKHYSRRFVEWAQNEIAVVPDFHKRILFSDEAHFWLNGYVNKQNCRIWSEDNPQVYVETPLHPEKLTVWCALWAGGILLQKR
ncbi:uncharacterized protein TNCV_526301 [Trichonephila clavipes]|nr:uncharacterized protein TNCV_526301 [Trichonephila clavipes]